MPGPLPNQSLWLATGGRAEPRPALDRDLSADVAVLGGGIVGVTTALELARRGLEVVLLEASRVGGGVTGHTTAKVTSLQGTIYSSISKRLGSDAARDYADANQAGMETLAALTAELGIDCDLRRCPNFTYAATDQERSDVEAEVEAAQAAGLDVRATAVDDLPYPVPVAARLDDQVVFHPIKYLLGLLAAAEAQGVRVFESTRAVGVEGRGPVAVRTERGQSVRAEHVIVATHFPFLDRGLHFARMHPERSYALALDVRGAVPSGMYLNAGSPTRSIRTHPHEGRELLLVGGEGHKVGQGDEAQCFARLEDWARRNWDVESVRYRWSSQDNAPADLLPFIGRVSPLSDRILTATGFRKWGLAMGTTAAGMLADAVTGQTPRWADTFDSVRLNPIASAADLAKENANVGYHFFRDRLQRGSTAELGPGEGSIVGEGAGQAAVYRDDAGILHALSARCTHLGCIVQFNDGERTWDCPCHGSRFAPTGEVLQGPAVAPLERKEISEDDAPGARPPAQPTRE